jgi:hypothetical protein
LRAKVKGLAGAGVGVSGLKSDARSVFTVRRTNFGATVPPVRPETYRLTQRPQRKGSFLPQESTESTRKSSLCSLSSLVAKPSGWFLASRKVRNGREGEIMCQAMPCLCGLRVLCVGPIGPSSASSACCIENPFGWVSHKGSPGLRTSLRLAGKELKRMTLWSMCSFVAKTPCRLATKDHSAAEPQPKMEERRGLVIG